MCKATRVLMLKHVVHKVATKPYRFTGFNHQNHGEKLYSCVQLVVHSLQGKDFVAVCLVLFVTAIFYFA